MNNFLIDNLFTCSLDDSHSSMADGGMMGKGGNFTTGDIIKETVVKLIETNYKFVTVRGLKYDRIELYRQFKEDKKYYGRLLYRKVPRYKETFKSKLLNERNQLFAFTGYNEEVAKAVLDGKKPFGSLVETYSDEQGKKQITNFFANVIRECKEKGLEYYLEKEHSWNGRKRRVLQICQKGTFGEIFDLDSFIEDYINSNVFKGDENEFINYVINISNRKLSYYLKNDWDNQYMLTGLILGIPLKFTMSLINSGRAYGLQRIQMADGGMMAKSGTLLHSR